MAVFEQSKDIQMQELIEDLQEKNRLLVAEQKDYKKTISSFVNVKQSYEDDKAQLAKKYQTQIQELNQNLEFEKKSVARKVNAALASIGVNMFAPEEISPNTDESPDAIYKKFISMPESGEKQAYHKKHEKLLAQFIGLQR